MSSRRHKTPSSGLPALRLLLLAIILFIAAWLAVVVYLPTYLVSIRGAPVLKEFLLFQKPSSVLVVYVFSGTDPEYRSNLLFFLEHGIQENDGCDYYIVLQKGPTLSDPGRLPDLPQNAQYVEHPNECYDIGTVGWLLKNKVNIKHYSYFIWMNSSTRGPFLPSYLLGKMHWTTALLSKLTEKVKLVGSTISCGGSHGSPPAPHIQSYLVATDSIGLQVLLGKGTVFRCYESMADVVIQSEIGMSTAILQAGYGIDSLMLRYQGVVDWSQRDIGTSCNGAMNPLQPGFNDELTVGPLEAMFVKVKSSMAEAGWPQVVDAVKMGQWMSATKNKDVLSKMVLANEWPVKHAPVLLADAQKRGQNCFDHVFYIRSNAYDLGYMADQRDAADLAWGQFLRMGIYEGRPYKFIC